MPTTSEAAVTTAAASTPQHATAYCRLPCDSVAWQPGAGPHIGGGHLEGAEKDVRDVRGDVFKLGGHVLAILEVHGQPLDLRAPSPPRHDSAGSHLAARYHIHRGESVVWQPPRALERCP